MIMVIVMIIFVTRYGLWRLHSKIVPDWLPPREPGKLTYRVAKQPEKQEAKEVAKKEETAVAEEEGEKESILDRFGRIIGRK